MSVTIHTTNGDIKIELFCDECKDACLNFLALCAKGYYNGCQFHRTIPQYIIQTGDPSLRGDGGETFNGENCVFEPLGDFQTAGCVGYADENYFRSQFFITAIPAPELSGKYLAFGKVIHGLNNVISISRLPCFEDFSPMIPVIITKVTIHANPLAEE